MRKRKTSIILFLNIMLLIALAATCLVGATVALFTTQDETIIIANSGKVKIDLLQAGEDGEYRSIRDTNGEVFGGGDWEPGQTRVVFLKVKSESSVKMKYTLRLNVWHNEMEGAFEYFAYRGDYFDTTGMSYEDLVKNTTPTDIEKGVHSLSGIDFIDMEPNAEHTYVLVLHMREESTNIYQGKTCTVDLNVIAVQGNAPTTTGVKTDE
ncbi:MAG: hypothetical protein IJW46_06490 [Clostridia bacterium]|nr:hypothetical protein [Clostridia bacterium]